MASRAELIQMCEELDIEFRDLSSDEMKDLIRKKADKKFSKKKYKISADKLSIALRKFLTLEYDYIILDIGKNQLTYDYKE